MVGRLGQEAKLRAVVHSLWLRGLRAPVSVRYGLGIAGALAASVLRIALNPAWGTSFPFIFFFPTTLFTSLFAGLGPASVGILISAAMTVVWILPPVGAVHVANPLHLVGIAIYLVADGVIACIGSTYRALIEQSEHQKSVLLQREAALKESEDRARRHAADAQAANRARDDALAILSHELRSPLTTIVAGVRVLRQIGSPDPKAASVRDAIERQADQLTRLVDDLLDVKRVVTGPVLLERRPCDLAESVGSSIIAWNGAGRFKEHTLSVDVTPVCVNGDPARLQQIIDNLITNAIKYTPAGGSIAVAVWPEKREAVLRVRDTGIGMSHDLLPRLFELFVQGDPGPGRLRAGLGIGLAVVHRLVELHGGKIEACSDGPGKGSTFTVRLPRVAPPSGMTLS